jgi:hypothetical protein
VVLYKVSTPPAFILNNSYPFFLPAQTKLSTLIQLTSSPKHEYKLYLLSYVLLISHPILGSWPTSSFVARLGNCQDLGFEQAIPSFRISRLIFGEGRIVACLRTGRDLVFGWVFLSVAYREMRWDLVLDGCFLEMLHVARSDLVLVDCFPELLHIAGSDLVLDNCFPELLHIAGSDLVLFGQLLPRLELWVNSL